MSFRKTGDAQYLGVVTLPSELPKRADAEVEPRPLSKEAIEELRRLAEQNPNLPISDTTRRALNPSS